MEWLKVFFEQVTINVCKNPEITAFTVLFNFFLLILLLAIIIYSNSKIKRLEVEKNALDSRLKFFECPLCDEDDIDNKRVWQKKGAGEVF